MATIEDALLGKVRNIGKLQREQILRAILSSPGTYNAIAREGPTAGAAYSRQYAMPGRGSGPDPLEVAKLKEKLLAQLSDMEKERVKGRGGVAQEIAKKSRDDGFKTILDFISDVYGKESSANAQIATSLNSAASRMAGIQAEAVAGALGGMGRTDAANTLRRISEATIDPVTGQATGLDPAEDPAFWQAVGQQMSEYSLMRETDPAAAREKLIGIDLAMRELGVDVDSLPRVPESAQPLAGMVIDELDATAAETQSLKQALEDKTNAIVEEKTKELVRGVRGLGGDKFADLAEMALKIKAGMEVAPDDLTSLMDEVAGDAKGPQPDAVKRIHDALAELEAIEDMPVPPATAKQARDDLFADPRFLQFMEENGFKDPKMALRALRQHARAKMTSDRASDRAKLREMRETGGGLNFSEAARQEGVEAVQAGTPPAPKDEEATGVFPATGSIAPGEKLDMTDADPETLKRMERMETSSAKPAAGVQFSPFDKSMLQRRLREKLSKKTV